MSDKKDEGTPAAEPQQKRGRGRPRKPKPDQVISLFFFSFQT